MLCWQIEKSRNSKEIDETPLVQLLKDGEVVAEREMFDDEYAIYTELMKHTDMLKDLDFNFDFDFDFDNEIDVDFDLDLDLDIDLDLDLDFDFDNIVIVDEEKLELKLEKLTTNVDKIVGRVFEKLDGNVKFKQLNMNLEKITENIQKEMKRNKPILDYIDEHSEEIEELGEDLENAIKANSENVDFDDVQIKHNSDLQFIKNRRFKKKYKKN